jgi:opacity protein-like surface antigen
MKRLATLATLAGLAASPALAQNWYIGAGAGTGNLDATGQDLTNLPNAQLKDNATTFTGRLGYRFSRFGAFELGYYDLGKYEFSGGSGAQLVTGSAKAKSYGISVVGIAPIGPLEIYSRVGYEESEIKVNANLGSVATGNASTKDNGATYALGSRWMFTPNFGVFVEWMRNDKIEVDSYLGGIDFRF